MTLRLLCAACWFLLPVYAWADDNNPTNEEITAKIAQITPASANLPENDSLLIIEINHVDADIGLAVRILSYPANYIAKYLEDLKKEKDAVIHNISVLKGLDCDNSRDYETLKAQLSTSLNKFMAVRADNVLWEGAPAINWAAMVVPYSAGAGRDQEVTSCTALKSRTADVQALNNPESGVDSVLKALQFSVEKYAAYRDQVSKWLDALKQRRAALQDKITSKTSQQQISGSLPYIIIAVGGFSVLTILTIKLFSPGLQLEWVASGQVIQFVTVMILLSAIMALGLSGIIKENTIGTLLGGVAGYVLAQGVGKAAGREAERRITGDQQGR